MAELGPQSEPAEIGQRVRRARRQRGLGLDAAAGLASISKSYLSMLENGQRRFERRGLLEDLAVALSCSVADLTGTPDPTSDRRSAEAKATLPPITAALLDATLDDVPDVPARPLDELLRLAHAANAASAAAIYTLAGRDLGALLTELHVHAVTGHGDDRRNALLGVAEACFVAAGNARSLGNVDLAVACARRAQEAARRAEAPALGGFAAMTGAVVLGRLGARHRAQQDTIDGLAELGRFNPNTDYPAAEAAGMLHLAAAQLAAKAKDHDVSTTHLDIAESIAERTGERNTMQFSFGPANVRAWSLSIAVELGRGPERAESVTAIPGFDDGLMTADRRAALHFDLARGFTQAAGWRDAEAIRHLDMADRIAPLRIRHDPLSREVFGVLDERAPRRTWVLDSLKNRLGVGSQIVNE